MDLVGLWTEEGVALQNPPLFQRLSLHNLACEMLYYRMSFLSDWFYTGSPVRLTFPTVICLYFLKNIVLSCRFLGLSSIPSSFHHLLAKGNTTPNHQSFTDQGNVRLCKVLCFLEKEKKKVICGGNYNCTGRLYISRKSARKTNKLHNKL